MDDNDSDAEIANYAVYQLAHLSEDSQSCGMFGQNVILLVSVLSFQILATCNILLVPLSTITRRCTST
jgi:hypothetical protein